MTEGSEAPAYALEAQRRRVGFSCGRPDRPDGTTYLPPNGTATFTVTAGFETTGVFLNVTQENFIKVCKVLANNLGALAGTPFNYTVNWTFTPPTKNLTFASYSGTELRSLSWPWRLPGSSARWSLTQFQPARRSGSPRTEPR